MKTSFFSLARHQSWVYGRCVKLIIPIFCALAAFVLPSCNDQKPGEVQIISETRPYVGDDVLYEHRVPKTWHSTGANIPGVGMRDRLVNYQFGKTGEVYVTSVGGKVLGNANRWLDQFGEAPKEDLSGFERIPFREGEALYVKATGTYSGRHKNWGLLGAIVKSGEGLITVKMLGSADEIAAEEENFKQFCAHFNNYKPKGNNEKN